MTATLGATSYTSVVWTSGDVITEAKLDNMVANDQAYNSHTAQGYLADNNKSHAGKTTGAVNINLVKMNTTDEIELGDTSLANKIKEVSGKYQPPQAYTPAASGTAAINLNTGNIHSITMPAGNISITVANAVSGTYFMVEITQDAVGSRTVTWFTTIRWVGGVAPVLTTTASKRDVFGFRATGTNTFDGFIVGLNL